MGSKGSLVIKIKYRTRVTNNIFSNKLDITHKAHFKQISGSFLQADLKEVFGEDEEFDDRQFEMKFDIWKMEEYNVIESWNQMHTRVKELMAIGGIEIPALYDLSWKHLLPKYY
ncbi:hypothetical protein Leryth_024643 [Lithospermum erythrorhizon]|nr:hypothetical protein Leryth_024643 [Lithospermum erythrorhizon]